MNQETLTIREVAQREESIINALLALWENCVRETHLFLSHKEISVIKPDAKNAIKSIPHLLVLEHSALEDSSANPLAFMGIAGENVEMLFVAHRGKGYGKKLLQYAVAHFKITQVAVNEQNPNAIGFYKHCGFEVYKRSERDEQGRAYPLLYMRLESQQQGGQNEKMV